MKQSSLKIAITGGIGSGKSTVAKFIAEQGFNVVSCDAVYTELLEDCKFVQKLSEEFDCCITEEGKLDKSKLSALVFNDKSKLDKLNGLTHPAIMEKALSLMGGNGISFCEVPLLFENGFERFFDGVIVVLRDINLRIQAAAKRDNITENQVKLRIKSQFDYDNSDLQKYYVIHNNGNLADLYGQTIKIIEKLKKNNGGR